MKKLFTRNTGAKLGQHLLTSAYIARDVVAAAQVTSRDTVLEIGPGKGMLTNELLEAGAYVVAVEKDSEMVAHLQTRFSTQLKNKQLVLVEEDVRDYMMRNSFSAPYKVVANIPYYITGELIRTFLTAENQPSAISLLVQKEVADRIARSKKESILSLSVKVFGEPRYIKTVRAGSFNPPPKVDSAILAIDHVSRNSFTAVSEEVFFAVVRQGFSQKRKTLLGNLKKVYKKEVLEDFWTTHALEKNIRAEDVPLSVWLLLTQTIET